MVKLTLTPFKGKLLKFLYILTRQRRFLSNAKLAELAGVTRRTIDSWLRYFSEPYTYKDYRLERKLSYFPHIVKKSLGLKVYTVFFHNPDWELAYTCPNKNFIGRLYDVERNCPVLAMECLVPVDRANDFKQIVELAPTYDLCQKSHVMKLSQASFCIRPFMR